MQKKPSESYESLLARITHLMRQSATNGTIDRLDLRDRFVAIIVDPIVHRKLRVISENTPLSDFSPTL